MNIYENLCVKDTDDRKRTVLRPARIVKVIGSVTAQEMLTGNTDSQVVLGVSEVCTLKNDGGEKALVLLDFGKEIHGQIKIYTCSVSTGTASLRIRLGESVTEALTPLGTKNAGNDHSPRDTEFVIGALSTHRTDESGFRYAAIELITDNCEVGILGVEGIFIYRDMEYKGSFECSDKLLNEIFDVGAYTVQLNMQNYLWDGIKRDRLVWVGDMNTEMLTALAVFGDKPVLCNSLELIRKRTPVGKWMNGMSSYTLWWFITLYNLYMWNGDKSYISLHKDYMTSTLDLLSTFVDENGNERLPEGRFFDHTANSNPSAVHAGLQALMYMAFDRASFLMGELGDAASEKKYYSVCEKLKGTNVSDYGGVKLSAAMMATSGISEAKKLCEDSVKVGKSKGFTTFMGYACLEALAKSGDFDCAIDCIKEYWGGMLKMGATTFWEDFDIDWMENSATINQEPKEGQHDIHGDFGNHCYKNFRHSLCHGWASAPTPYLTSHVLGIVIKQAGCKKVEITPHLGNLDFARGSFPTPYGVIEVSHEKKDGKVVTSYSAPEEIEVVLK